MCVLGKVNEVSEVLLSPHFGLDGTPEEDKISTKCQNRQENTERKALCFLLSCCFMTGGRKRNILELEKTDNPHCKRFRQWTKETVNHFT